MNFKLFIIFLEKNSKPNSSIKLLSLLICTIEWIYQSGFKITNYSSYLQNILTEYTHPNVLKLKILNEKVCFWLVRWTALYIESKKKVFLPEKDLNNPDLK